MKCPSCTADLSPSHRFCPSCGAPISSVLDTLTAAAESPPVPAARALVIDAPVGRVVSSGSISAGGFTPGMILADRYRIIGLLGRGGMGEVYRADDLKLGQAVALKFLPTNLADDPVRRERFHAEVRIARQVSHPNICRVYDIGETGHRLFLTMEFVDGENLASLLKRIGHLHGAKALDIARQLCAGMAAAHSKGVLHRDLKPANVMLDGHGRVRVTDFGLAVVAGEEAPTGDISGTPAYMAPEQFAGEGASAGSDIYSLGMVLYELYTGKCAFEAASLAELRAKKERTPAAPSEIVRDVDPIVERVILRCLEKDPRLRPASVARVASALPGGDPLAAAIAAGETPSPEMVAASGSTEGLKPWIAWACLGFVILGLGVSVLFGRRMYLYSRMPMDKPPDVLIERAYEILKNTGHPEAPADSAYGFEADSPYFDYVRAHDRSATRWDRLPDSAMMFWYRQSPRALAHEGFLSGVIDLSGVTLEDPPRLFSGEELVTLDSRGRLICLEVLPPQVDESSGAAPAPDWSVLFREAGLDPAKWIRVQPAWTPPLYADTRAAWQGTSPENPDVPIRIEAAAYRGKPVSWSLIRPWNVPSRMAPYKAPWAQRAQGFILLALVIVVIAGGAFFAKRNLRMGRGDRRGAARLAILFCVLTTVGWIFGEHHVSDSEEVVLFAMFVCRALSVSGILWLVYMAFEPFVRRRWPAVLISWSRLLSGSFSDPLVGRDLLVGCVLGTSGSLLDLLNFAAHSWFGVTPDQPVAGDMRIFTGARAIVPGISYILTHQILFCLAWLFLLFLLRVLIHRRWAAELIWVMLFVTMDTLSSDSPLLDGTFSILKFVLLLLVLMRFGLVALAAALLFGSFVDFFPITPELSAWYSGIGMAGVGLMLAMVFYAFHTSLGGRPLFGHASLED